MSDSQRPADRPNKLLAYDSCDPIHHAGDKPDVQVSHTVTGLLNGNVGTVHLSVTGPQVSLQPNDVLGVYPAPGSEDSPTDFLPHVVLRRRTLPWERHGPQNNGPWLALLLLDDDELGGEVPRTVEVSALDQAVRDRMTGVGIASNTRVTVIDVPHELVARVLPPPDELAYLCHMRSLQSDSPLRSLDDDGDVAVIIGNRLPNEIPAGQQGHVQHAFLISVEGRDDLWSPPQPASAPTPKPAPAATPSRTTATTTKATAVRSAPMLRRLRMVDTRLSTTRTKASRIDPARINPELFEHLHPQPIAKVSVLVLHQWSFRCAAGGDFEEVIKDIRYVPNGGVLRFGTLPRTTERNSLSSIVTSQGRLSEPLDYAQVPGHGAIYRGPLLPHKPSTRADVYAVRAKPDEFNPLGLPSTPIERSDLIAFELGRLLALSDESMLAAMQRVAPKLELPELPELLAVDPRPPALRWPDPIIDPSPELWNEIASKWVRPGGVSMLDKAGLANKATDLGGLQKLLDQQPALLADISQKLAQIGQIDPGQLGQLGQIDIGQLDGGLLDQQFGALINAARS